MANKQVLQHPSHPVSSLTNYRLPSSMFSDGKGSAPALPLCLSPLQHLMRAAISAAFALQDSSALEMLELKALHQHVSVTVDGGNE